MPFPFGESVELQHDVKIVATNKNPGAWPGLCMHSVEPERSGCCFSLPPSPPAEKAAARQDQAGKASAEDRTGDGGHQRPGARHRSLGYKQTIMTNLLNKITAVVATDNPAPN